MEDKDEVTEITRHGTPDLRFIVPGTGAWSPIARSSGIRQKDLMWNQSPHNRTGDSLSGKLWKDWLLFSPPDSRWTMPLELARLPLSNYLWLLLESTRRPFISMPNVPCSKYMIKLKAVSRTSLSLLERTYFRDCGYPKADAGTQCPQLH